MKVLEKCHDPVVIDIWRQMGPVISPGSSPTPILSTLPEQISPHYAKVDMKSYWDPNITSDSGKSSMKMKSSGSQTDSLDSPVQTPYPGKERKSDKELDHKGRSSGGHMIDKALEKIKNFSRPRHKSQERQEIEDGHSKPDMMSVSVSTTDDDNIITEFDFPVPKTIRPDSNRQKNGRKRELESENSGTWPKCYRGFQPQVNGTVGLPSPQKKSHERPSIENFFPRNGMGDKTPPAPPERTLASLNAVRQSPHHSPQSSDSTIKNYPHSPVHSPKTSSKSQPYLPSSSIHSNQQPGLTFNPDTAIQTLDRNQHSSHKPPSSGSRNNRFQGKRNPPSSHYDVPTTHKDKMDGRSMPVSSYSRTRQRSAPDKDKRSSHVIMSPKSSQMYSSTESSNSNKDQFAFPQRNISPNPRWSSDFTAVDPMHSLPPYMPRSGHSQKNQTGRWGYFNCR